MATITTGTQINVNSAATGAARGAADYTRDFAPEKLLVNHKWIGERLDDIRRNGKRTDGSAKRGPDESLIFIYITKPTGGTEYRPLARFDVLPSNPVYFVLSTTHKKPTFLPLALDYLTADLDATPYGPPAPAADVPALAVPVAPPASLPTLNPVAVLPTAPVPAGTVGGPDAPSDSAVADGNGGWILTAEPDAAPAGLDVEPAAPAADVAPPAPAKPARKRSAGKRAKRS